MFRPEPAQAQLQLQVAGAIPVDGRRGRIPGAEAAPSPPESGPSPTYNENISPQHYMYRRYGLRAPFGHWPMHDEGPAVSITKCACCEAGGNHRAVSDAVPFELPPPPSPPPTQRQGRPAKSVARSNSEASSTSSRSRSSSSLKSLSPLSERRKRASSSRSTRSSESSSSSVSTSSSWSTISASSALSSPQQEQRRASCSVIPSPNTAPLLKQRWASCGAINASSSTALVRSGRENVTLCISQPSGEQTSNDVIASVVSSTSEEQTTVNYSASPTSVEETVADTSVPSTSGKETVADVSFPPTSGEDTVADCISVLPTAGQPTKATVHLSASAGQPTKAVNVPPKTVKKSAAIFSIKRVMFSPSLYSGKRSNGSVCVAQSFGNPTQASVSNSATSEKPTGASVSASVPERRHTQATFSAEQLPQDSSSAQSLAPSSPPSAPLSKSVQPQLQPTASASAVPSLQLPSSSLPSAAAAAPPPQQPPPADNTSSEDSFGAANDAQNSREPFVASYEDDQGGTYVGSFPKGFGYGPDEAEIEGAASPGEEKPRILLMGLRRSGKSSIQKVVFHKVSPNETLFLESTNKIVKDDISNSSFVQFQIWDIPGQIDFFDSTFDSEYIFGGCGALIFVIDAQDDYMEALSRLQMAVTRAHKINENIKFEVFIHKVDGLSDDNKIETQRDILQRATDELADAGMDNIRLSFHLTSIYDHSIFEAFSKVVQKLIPQLPVLENLLDIVISNSKIEKAFLFDVVSKIYIATDSSPVDMQCYELCCDMIDVVIDMSCIYGVRDDGAFDNESASFIKLNSSTVLFLREVNRHLALLCILREDGCENRGIIEYNFKCFRNAIQEVFVARNKEAGERAGHKLVRAEDGAVAKPHGGQSNGLLGAAGSSHSHLNGSVVKEGEDN